MAQVLFGGQFVQTSGDLPPLGRPAPDAVLVNGALQSSRLHDYDGVRVLNIFPSVATPICQASVRRFHESISGLDGVVVLNISKDLPFAQSAFCAAQGLDNVEMMSTFRGTFGRDFGVEFLESPFEGLLSRSVLVLDGEGTVIYAQQAKSTDEEPDYEPVIEAVRNALK